MRTSFTGKFEINQVADIIKLIFAGFGERSGYNLVLRRLSAAYCVRTDSVYR